MVKRLLILLVIMEEISLDGFGLLMDFGLLQVVHIYKYLLNVLDILIVNGMDVLILQLLVVVGVLFVIIEFHQVVRML